MPSEECQRTGAAIATRDFVGWRGFPAGCSASDLLAGIPDDLTDRPARPLGDHFDPAAFVVLDLAGWYRPMASFRDGDLVLFDGMNPELVGGFDRLM